MKKGTTSELISTNVVTVAVGRETSTFATSFTFANACFCTVAADYAYTLECQTCLPTFFCFCCLHRNIYL